VFLEFAFVGVFHFGVKCLLALLKGLFVHLIVLLSLLKLESRDVDFKNCVGCIVQSVPFFLEEGLILQLYIEYYISYKINQISSYD